ncbi:MAG: hypothetical protein B5M48_04630 [Candidatus Omnitrophica bacterium 4484_213]|nr:MAG: hypothetical protein B5M48_04630 [Candidatus Omnitrophica bacterium 4484_213]
MIIQILSKVISNTQIVENYFKMCLDAPAVAQKAEPGQFIYVHTSDGYQPLLRRAFSIHNIRREKRENREQMEILYKVRGEGTRILVEKKAGEKLDIIGPLGKGFTLYPLPSTLYPVLVGGGVGIAPLVFLAQNLAKNQKPKTKNRILVLIGAKTKKEILCKDEFERLGCEVKVATDDGSQSFKGKVTELLEEILAPSSKLQAPGRELKKPVTCSLQPVACIYACGPSPMLKEIAQLAQQYKIPCQVSLEERMACGVGACRGCVLKVVPPPPSPLLRSPQDFIYKRVCKDGPVFETGEIIWE